METKSANVNRILKKILVVESVLWLLGAVIITNMSPAWMQIAVAVLTLLVLGTAFLYVVVNARRIYLGEIA